MLFVNTKTGAKVESLTPVAGDNWVLLDDLEDSTEQVQEETEDSTDEIDLAGMKLDELKTLAAELDIRFESNVKKADLIKRLEDAFAEE
jgi:predicted  nucleic acid-binding Zn-ribbon protein